MDDVTAPSGTALLRIGELSRRLGVSEHVLRAWERRYGLLRPVRSPGGFRLYSSDDLDRVRRMQAHLAGGLSAAQAAQASIAEESAASTPGRPQAVIEPASEPPAAEPPAARAATEPASADRVSTDAVRSLAAGLDGFDESAAHEVLDRLLNTLTVETVLRDVVLPYLRQLGQRWAAGEVTIAQEHFASNVVRGRLVGLAQGWGRGRGPRAVLACAPGELHDIALVVFGVVLSRAGWRIDFLGADTPLDEIIRTAREHRPDLVVVAGSTSERFARVTDQLTRLAATAPLALAGAGATEAVADAVGARLLTADPVTAAQRASGGAPPPS